MQQCLSRVCFACYQKGLPALNSMFALPLAPELHVLRPPADLCACMLSAHHYLAKEHSKDPIPCSICGARALFMPVQGIFGTSEKLLQVIDSAKSVPESAVGGHLRLL